MNRFTLLNDLEWLLNERECFVTDRSLANYLLPDWRQRLSALAHAPDPLIQHMSQVKSHFLGTYFEQLFSFAVRHFTDLVLLAEHHQIHDAGKTIGEVDLLAKDRVGTCIQFEVALKFYLLRSDLVPNEWIGPNKKDSLIKKVTHAREHQLQVLHQGEGLTWLKSMANTSDYERNLMIFGRHFYPLNTDFNPLLDSKTCHGGWVYLRQLLALRNSLDALRLAEKPGWITPSTIPQPTHSIDATLVDALEQGFVHDERPKLFSCQRLSDLAPRQVFWLFVCPNHW